MADIFSGLGDLVNNILAGILALFPDSPFKNMLVLPDSVKEILGYINWFIPVREIRIATYTWIIAVGVYYTWMIALRTLKAVE